MVPMNPVHPDFCIEMRTLIKAMTPQPGSFGYEPWERRNRELWRRACEGPEKDP